MRAMIAALLLAAATPAAAEVVDAQPGGFDIKAEATISAPPEKVYAALANVGSWWSSDHTFSGSAANMTLDPRAGGCFCEKLPGGGVQHMTVIYADAGKALRLKGALGPFQQFAVEGVLTWEIAPAPGGSKLTQSYLIGGYAPGGLTALAPIADKVLNEQLARLKLYVETGKPQ